MLNHAGRFGWTLHEGTLRPDVLGRAAGGKALRLPPSNRHAGADEDEAPTSTETQSKMHEAIARLGAGAADAAGAGAAQAIDEVIRSFRKDNAMGGRGVFEHLPLPHDLARTMASYFDGLDERKKQPVFNDVISQLEPSVRTHVAQQVTGLVGHVGGRDVNIAGSRNALFESRPREVADPHLTREVLIGSTRGYGESKTLPYDGAPMQAQPLSAVDVGPGMTWGGSTPPHRPNDKAEEKARQLAEDNASHLTDYNDGRIAETVDQAIAASTWLERRTGHGGAKVRGQGRYVWTRYGWVDLQHVIGAATATPYADLNLLLGLFKEVEQWSGGMKSAGKTEDYLSNWIGAQALVRQRLVGGTIGQAVAYVLAQYRPMTRKQAEEFLRKGA